MVGPIRFDGPVSGIDYTSIIQKLLDLQRRPIASFKSRIDAATGRKNALLEVNLSLLALKSSADTLSKPSFFASNTVGSSNASALSAGATTATPLGTYSFTVRRLAQAHQIVSNGFASASTPVTAAASSLTLEVGGGFLDRDTPVAFLNGQTGFDRGSILLSDGLNSETIDLSGAVTVKDVLDAINGATRVPVRAAVAGNRLTVEHRNGGALTISDVGADFTATTLGIAGASAPGSSFVYGSDINTLVSGTPLAMLNDGLGVRRNIAGMDDFTVTGADGTSFGVDLEPGDVTLQHVVDRINAAATGAGSGVQASLAGNALRLEDSGGAGALSVADAFGSFAAADLGLGIFSGGVFVSNAAEDENGDEAAAQRRILVGRSLAPALNSTLRTVLNGGRGVADGSIVLTDRTGASTSVDVSRRVSNIVASDLGSGSLKLAGTAQGLAVGNRVRVSTDTGIEYRTVTEIIPDVTGDIVVFDEPLSGAVQSGDAVFGLNDSVEDLVRLLNDRAQAGGVQVRVEANSEGNGLRVVDLSGGAGALTIAGAPGVDLGIAGSTASNVLNGGDLDPQYLAETTALAAMNGGKGVAAGRFRIVDTQSIQFDIDLSQADDVTLGDAIQEINATAAAFGSGVQARINDTGDGLLLTDTTPGAGLLQVQELDNGRTAKDLNLAGTAAAAAPATIDGSFERTIAIAANATLADVAAAINQAAAGVTAAVINDGSAFNPHKLLLTSQRTGRAGRITVDGAIAGLAFSTVAAPQDAVVVYGTGGAGEPLVISASTNQVTGVVPGMTLDLKGVTSAPVTVSVTRDTEGIVAQAQRFVDDYNDVIAKIREFTFFNPDTFATGPLFGDPAVRRVRRDLSALALNPVLGIAPADLNLLSEVGIKAGAEGTLTFDGGELSSRLASDFDEVQRLFVLQRPLQTTTPLRDLNNGLGITDATGDDFTVHARDGVTVLNFNAAGFTTLGSLLVALNNTPGNNGAITAQIAADGFSIELVDNSVIPARAAGGATTATEFDAVEGDLSGLADNRIVGSTITFTSGANAGEVRQVVAFDPLTDRITLDAALPSASFSGDAYRLERELEVRKVGLAPAASELKILKKLALGQNVLKGDLIGLQGDPGVAARLSEGLDFITRSGDGLIATRTEGIDESVEDLNESIASIEKRIEALQERLIRKFARLETVVAQSQSTSQRLSILLSGLMSSSGGGGFSGF